MFDRPAPPSSTLSDRATAPDPGRRPPAGNSRSLPARERRRSPGEEPGTDPEKRGLPRAVLPDEGHGLARPEVEVHFLQDGLASEPLGDTPRDQRNRSIHSMSRGYRTRLARHHGI